VQGPSSAVQERHACRPELKEGRSFIFKPHHLSRPMQGLHPLAGHYQEAEDHALWVLFLVCIACFKPNNSNNVLIPLYVHQ
jgi:hypothetical protein